MRREEVWATLIALVVTAALLGGAMLAMMALALRDSGLPGHVMVVGR